MRKAFFDSTGPTIEMIEVAKEWRAHGVGRLFYLSMEKFMCQAFKGMHGPDETYLDLHACNVTNEGAARFFLAVKFKDADGMMEELTKTLEGYGECFADSVEDCKRRPVASGPMPNHDIAAALPQYNKNAGTNLEGRPCVGEHRKPCTDCGAGFDSYGTSWYFTDSRSPWGADKFCSDCMASRLGGHFIEEESEEDDY